MKDTCRYLVEGLDMELMNTRDDWSDARKGVKVWEERVAEQQKRVAEKATALLDALSVLERYQKSYEMARSMLIRTGVKELKLERAIRALEDLD